MEKGPDYEKLQEEFKALKEFLHDLTFRLKDSEDEYKYRIKKLQEAGVSEEVSCVMNEKYLAHLSEAIDKISEEINQEHLLYIDEVEYLYRPDIFIV